MNHCLILLLSSLVATVAFPTAMWPTRVPQDRIKEQLMSRSGLPSIAYNEVERTGRSKRDTAALGGGNARVSTTTFFNNTHLYQPHINLTINNMFGSTAPNADTLAAVVHSVNMFQNVHLHQPRMNVTINNCF